MKGIWLTEQGIRHWFFKGVTRDATGQFTSFVSSESSSYGKTVAKISSIYSFTFSSEFLWLYNVLHYDINAKEEACLQGNCVNIYFR